MGLLELGAQRTSGEGLSLRAVLALCPARNSGSVLLRTVNPGKAEDLVLLVPPTLSPLQHRSQVVPIPLFPLGLFIAGWPPSLLL
jgi:hypothetical protein